jgi:hypothetical protein
MKQLEVQDAGDARRGLAGDADGLGVGGVVVGLGPAAGTGDDLDAVGAQSVQLTDSAGNGDGFEVGVAGDEEVAIPGFEQIRGGGGGVGAGKQGKEGVLGELLVASVEEQGHAGGGLGDHADGAIENGILHEAFAGEGGVFARRPRRGGEAVEEEAGGGEGFGDGRALLDEAAEPIHHCRDFRKDS